MIKLISEDVIIEEINKFRAKLTEEKYAKHFKNWNKVMQYHFTDIDKHYYIKLANGVPSEIFEGEAEKPEIAYTMDTETFIQIQRGELKGLKAYNSGKVKVKASIPDLLKLQKLN